MSNDAIEAAWKELTAPQNETVTSRWYFKKGFEAATKAALGSRAPLTAEQVDSLLPSEEEFLNIYDDEYGDDCKALRIYEKLRESIKKRLGCV